MEDSTEKHSRCERRFLVDGIMTTFVETYFGKAGLSVSSADVESFVATKLPESLTLEYKSIDLFAKPDDISVTISSLANATGGLFCLGVREDPKTHLPERVEWSDPKQYPKETLENLLVPRLHPRVEGMAIHPILNPSKQVTFLIDVPSGQNPPYMAGDKRYYKRLNFRKVPMEGYEVADLFGRRRRPVLGLLATIEPVQDLYNLTVLVTNFGKAPAKDIFILIQFKGCQVVGAERFEVQAPNMLALYSSAPNFQPIYPHPSRSTQIGRLSFKPIFPPPGTRPTQEGVTFSYEVSTEESPSIQGRFTVPNASIPPDPTTTVLKAEERTLEW
jgi:hypothetical protein